MEEAELIHQEKECMKDIGATKEQIDGLHDEILKKMFDSTTADGFISIGYEYELVCVATYAQDMNVYLVPYIGGTTIIIRRNDGHIDTSRVGAEVAQMLVDMGVVALKKIDAEKPEPVPDDLSCCEKHYLEREGYDE